MTLYPNAIDGDAELTRVDDDITEIGAEAINQIREAVFAIQQELGIRPSGTVGSLTGRLSVSLNDNGTIKTSAFASVGLVTLPITDNQVGTNAGISEFKLNLDHSTSDLYNLTISNQSLINSVVTFTNTLSSDLNTHIAGGQLLADGDPARHVASHIDLNAVPSDSRDLAFAWTGLLDVDGNARTATTVAEGLLQINNELVDHQNAVANAHPGTAIDLDVDNFTEIPKTVDTVQKFAQHVNDFEVLTVGEHRAIQHANAIPLIARSDAATTADGYSQNIVPSTPVNTYLVTSPNIIPVDDLSTGDDIINFKPDNTGFVFDGQFSQVAVGDIVTVNYGNGFEASFPVESIRYVPGTRWIVRINGTNLADNTADGYALARIDRPKFDRNTAGVLAVAAANATPVGSFNSTLSSLIVGNPRGATALGNGFDPNQLNGTHYNLYLEMYPTGNPADRVISLPAVDVTGNQGSTPGQYTLDTVVQETNNALREIGFNLRLISFAYEGNFGIMLADAINNVSFSISTGVLSSVTGLVEEGTLTNNVIGVATGDGYDALGLGPTHADLAGPTYASTTSFVDSTAAQNPTKVIVPFNRRNYVVDGRNVNTFAPTWAATEDANGDFYWDGYISARTPVGSFTVETTYTINLDLKAAGLKPGKTVVIQPTIDFSDSNYFDTDYGRFIIKSVSFPPECPGDTAQTFITVINGIHATGVGFGFSSEPSLPVRVYFSEDSVSFNNKNVINTIPTALDYHRFHEVFISNKLNTFSHERARMPVQNETGSLLSSTNWHVENVSPKLRGYPDTTLSQDRFIRLFILSYDTATGQYDGYIGKRAGSGIVSLGPVTTGRKDVVTRFYDETNVDFIDLRYIETGTDLGSATAILSDGTSGGGGTPRYVDIELFPSLRNNDEMLLLATCEVNWDPIVERVIDRREFGSIDEEDFTQSAIDFIRAGDRFLHDNGVLRGLDFDFISTINAGEIFFKGGVALVNGNIVNVNNISATIPQITENPTTSDTLDWAICVDEFGNLVPVLLVASDQQFFARDLASPNNTYYVPSYTFQELIEERKDLTPIYIANVTIASVTVNDTSDVRRFVDDGKKRELVFSPEDFAGTFHTVEGLRNWVNNYASSAPVNVKVRGNFVLTSTLSFAGFEYPVILEGDGANLSTTAAQGFLIDSNVTFKNINFTYNPTGITYTTNDQINSANGCIFHSGTNADDIRIENCKFTSTLTTQRPPFISFELASGEYVRNLVIKDNFFSDAAGTAAAYQAAIALVHVATTGSSSLLRDIVIDNNRCDNHQGIHLIAETNSAAAVVLASITQNVKVTNNNCGVIGLSTTGGQSSIGFDTRTNRTSGLEVSNNVAGFIATLVNAPAGAVIEGTEIYPNSGGSITYPISMGSYRIFHNDAHWIRMAAGNDDSANEFNSFLISENKLDGYVTTYQNNWSAGGSAESSAISCITTTTDDSNIIISNNTIKQGRYNSTDYEYNYGIRLVSSEQSAAVLDNIIKGIATSGIGISTPSSFTGEISIKGNKIYRRSNSITRYIGLSTSGAGVGLCVDNFLDNHTINGSDIETISTTTSNWSVSNNKNHQQVVTLNNVGIWGIDDTVVGNDTYASRLDYQNSTALQSGLDTSAVEIFYDNTDGLTNFGQRISMLQLLPLNVKVIDITLTMVTSISVGATGVIYINNTPGLFTPLTVNKTVNNTPIVFEISENGSFDPDDFINNIANNIQFHVNLSITHSAPLTASISSLVITFRW